MGWGREKGGGGLGYCVFVLGNKVGRGGYWGDWIVWG